MGRRNTGSFPRGVKPTQDGTIQISFTYEGVACRERLPLSPTPANLELAKEKRNKILREITRGTFDYANHFPRSRRARVLGSPSEEAPLVGQALDKFLRQNRPHLQFATYRDYERSVAILKEVFRERRLSQIRSTEMRDWVRDRGITMKRARNLLYPLRFVLAEAVSDRIIPSNPLEVMVFTKAEFKRESRSEADPYTPGEVDRLVHAAEAFAPVYSARNRTWTDVRQAAGLIPFNAYTGLRLSEVIALRWEDIDLAAGTIRVERACVRGQIKDVKTPAGRRHFKLLPAALRALAVQHAHTGDASEWVFTTPEGERWSDDQQLRKRLWKPLMRACAGEVRWRGPNQLRHTFASWALTAGEEPAWIAYRMGHADWGLIRRRYANWVPEMETGAGKRLAELGWRSES